MIRPTYRQPGRTAMSRGALGLVLVALIAGQSATTVAATEYASGPVYGGTFAWMIPALTAVAPTGNGSDAREAAMLRACAWQTSRTTA